MPEQSSLNRLIELLELTIVEVRNLAKQNKPISHLLSSFEGPTIELLAFLASLEKDADVTHRSEIYADIANVIQKKMEDDVGSFATYCRAVCSLCNETEPAILTRFSSEPSDAKKVEDIVEIAKKNILAIKLYYIKADNAYKQKIEVFSVGDKDDRAAINRIEKEISWDALPLDVRHTFYAEDKEAISFQLYP